MTDERLPISICLISGAEAHRIGRTLESVATWAGEIVVVLNQEVRDGTEQICRQFGASVYREPWKGHVAQKNSAAEKALKPWILGLDADEVVSPDLREEIQKLFADDRNIDARTMAFSMPRLSFYAGQWIRHGDWYPDRKTRLWRRGRAKWTGTDPHDYVKADGPVLELRGDLHHYSYDSLDHHVNKLQTYADISAREAIKAGKPFRLTDLVVRPPWRFVRAYVFRLGFLDGVAGFQIAWLTALLAFLKYARMRELRATAAASQR